MPIYKHRREIGLLMEVYVGPATIGGAMLSFSLLVLDHYRLTYYITFPVPPHPGILKYSTPSSESARIQLCHPKNEFSPCCLILAGSSLTFFFFYHFPFYMLIDFRVKDRCKNWSMRRSHRPIEARQICIQSNLYVCFSSV